MHAMIPFTWQAEYLLKGGAKSVTRVFGELMAVDIPEYSAEEAPAVVSWLETNGEPSGVRNPIDVRMIDGQFYMQATNRMFHAAGFGKDRLNGPVNEDYKRLFHHLTYFGGNVQKHLDAFSDALNPVRGRKRDVAPATETIEHILSDDRERREQLFRAVAEDIAIIDGAVWTRVCEPTVVIHDDVKPENAVWNGTVDTVACAICVSRPAYGERFVSGIIGISIGLPDTTTVYSIADWEEACAAHAEIAHPRPDRYTQKRYFEDVQIHDPSVLGFDPVCSPVARTVAYALNAFGKDMAEWTRGAATMFMDIRDALEEFETSGDVPSLEHAVKLLSAFMDRAGTLDTSAQARVKRGLARYTLDDAGIALSVGEGRGVATLHP
ncbi:hypothetical protein OIU34_20255 [Pararhizobium sp. BT-229]|uniref:hypothetical protein n=1 Tax=Pararhizobium sp. BT-229 TaxID=2986923 RepID=UPI0021F6D536|nr:hypothetical protein [Pararhizobium sp. BT-229]MCV9964221.1 hypothetical protein [Pararhizobium sp. BT-229]